jgi:hypothetical protein
MRMAGLVAARRSHYSRGTAHRREHLADDGQIGFDIAMASSPGLSSRPLVAGLTGG